MTTTISSSSTTVAPLDVFDIQDILNLATNIVGCLCRGLEILIVIFLTFQLFKKNSNYRSAYFIILNVGYISDIALFINWLYPMDLTTYYVTIILNKWHNTFFLSIWNTALCLNRCTALAFSKKHEKIWNSHFYIKMPLIVALMLLFPFIIDGYALLKSSCSLKTPTPCLKFRQEYFFKGLIVNGFFNTFLLVFIFYCMLRSRDTTKVQVHSLHAKIERRLIYQAIFCSIFQLIYFTLNYLSSLDSNAKVLFIYVHSSTLGYHLQHYAVMITHFIFSPTFKIAFLSFYHLKFLTNDRNTTKIIMLSKGAVTQIGSGPRPTRTISSQ